MPLSSVSCQHQSSSPTGLKSASENESNTNKPFKCGECQGHFSAICILHSHLKGGSYQYEAETMTVFPIYGASCSEDKESESEPGSPNPNILETTCEETLESRPENELDKPSEKYYKVYTVRRLKRKRSGEPGAINIIKIVDQPYIKVEENESLLYSNLDNLVVEHAYESVDETNGFTDSETNINKTDDDESENVVIKSEANVDEYIEQLDQYSESEPAEIHREQHAEPDVTNIQSEHSEVLISRAENVNSENDNDTQTAEIVEKSQSENGEVLTVEAEPEDKLDDTINCNIKLPALYKALISTTTENHVNLESPVVDSHHTLRETLQSSEVGSNNQAELQEMPDDIDIQTVIVDNMSGSTVGDKDLEQTVAAFNKLAEPQSQMNKQVVVTLYGIETDADGSVQIVVGEEDAAIFNTAIGDELLKALRAQANDIPANESTQIVFNYSDTQTREPHFMKYSDLSEQTVGIISDERSHISYFRTPKRQRRMDKDDSLPKFRIQLPMADVQSDLSLDLDNTSAEVVLKPVEIKPIVFKVVHEKLGMPDALNILTECNLGQHSDLISKTQPILAKGGELYVVDLEALPDRKDCRYDKYLWVNCVTRKFPKKNPILNKHVFKIRLPNSQFSDAYQRHIYQFIEEARYCIIHYIGHEGVFQPLAHGNSKSGAVFSRTCPSVLKELKDLSKEDGMTANKLHKQIESLKVPSDIKGFRTPRNLSQIKNTFRYARKTKVKQDT